MTIKSCKLLNGEEIIGDFSDEVEGIYTVEKLRLAVLHPVSETQARVIFAPWLYTNPDGKNVKIRADSCTSKPDSPEPGIEKEYSQSISSIIQP